MKTLKDYQHLFSTDIDNLLKTEQSELDYIVQNHFGDFLIETAQNGDEKYQLWRNNDENINQGSPIVEITYFGYGNRYCNEVILEHYN